MDFLAQHIAALLDDLGAVLELRGLTYEIVVIGGASLQFHDIVDRTTIDVDVLARREGAAFVQAKPLPQQLLDAVRLVADVAGVDANWCNDACSSEWSLGLPAGYERRLSTRRHGALTVHFVAPEDLVAFKLAAAADHVGDPLGKHLADLRALDPDDEVLRAAIAWIDSCAAPGSAWSIDVAAVLRELGKDGDAYGL